MTSEYLWHMEDVLYQYAQPYDPLIPLLCYDERPCQLLGDVLAPLPMQPGYPARYDYEYERNGTGCILLAFDPHTGFRYVQVRARRTAVDYAQFMQDLVKRHYPDCGSHPTGSRQFEHAYAGSVLPCVAV